MATECNNLLTSCQFFHSKKKKEKKNKDKKSINLTNASIDSAGQPFMSFVY